MLSILIKKFKDVLKLLLVGALIIMTTSTTIASTINKPLEYCSYNVIEATERQCDVVVRVGEYNLKPGKRIYIDNIDIQWKDIPKDIPIHKDDQGHFISEFDINLKLAKKVNQELINRGITTKLQIAEGKKQDLNQAGRIANASNSYVYLSLHHNYYSSTSNGYLSMYNQGDTKAKEIANRLCNSIQGNGKVRRIDDIVNTGQIGELNKLSDTTIGVLMELGFFSNPKELKVICSDSYTDYVATHLADEITNIIQDLK